MKEFKGFGSFATHLKLMALEASEVTHHMADRAAEEIQKTAQGEIGFYQDQIGPYAAWEQLADSTEAEKARLGFEPDAPLLRTGGMRKSINRTVIGNDATVGSNDPTMIYHELGTTKMAPRAVLGPAAIHSKGRVKLIIGSTMFAWLSGRGWLRPAKITGS